MILIWILKGKLCVISLCWLSQTVWLPCKVESCSQFRYPNWLTCSPNSLELTYESQDITSRKRNSHPLQSQPSPSFHTNPITFLSSEQGRILPHTEPEMNIVPWAVNDEPNASWRGKREQRRQRTWQSRRTLKRWCINEASNGEPLDRWKREKR